MELLLPEKKMVAHLFEQPQLCAIEIRIDRLELFTQDLFDVEDSALWVQVLDLPCMEMLPYQRDHTIYESSTESLGFLENLDASLRNHSFTNQSIKIAKKVSLAAVSDIQNAARSSIDDYPNTSEEEQRRKLRDKRKSVFRKEKIKKSMKNSSKKSLNKRSSHSSGIHDRKKSGSRSLNLKTETKMSSSQQEVVEPVAEDMQSSAEQRMPSKEETFKDGDSSKKFKLLTKLLGSEPEHDVPGGVAFYSDCCIMIPFPSVSTALYKMERMPVIIYVVQLTHACSKLIGKVCVPMGYCFQQAVIKAAKLRGGMASKAVQEAFPIYATGRTGKSDLKVGQLHGSIKLICYGNFGITEIKGPNGDLMSRNLNEWKANYRDLSQGLGREGIDVDEQPYGFTPTMTRNTLPPPGRQCPSNVPIESMLDFLQMFQ